MQRYIENEKFTEPWKEGKSKYAVTASFCGGKNEVFALQLLRNSREMKIILKYLVGWQIQKNERRKEVQVRRAGARARQRRRGGSGRREEVLDEAATRGEFKGNKKIEDTSITIR